MTKRPTFYLLILFLSFLVCLPAIVPFFHAGYFPTHDGEWAVVRLGDMFRTLRDFQVPARYSGNLNFGYGYPLFNFAYPFPYYAGVLFHFLGFGFVTTIKFLFAGTVVLSAFFMFFASRALWKSTWAGIISAILYIYFPYRMIDLYVRGSIGECLSFVLFPLLLFLTIKLINRFSFLYIGAISLSFASLVMSHNIMTVLFIPFYVVFVLIYSILINRAAIKLHFASIFLGLGLSAFFWAPALLEKSNILLSKIPIADRGLYFVTLKQFLVPTWGYGAPLDTNGFSYQLGLAHLVLFIISALFLLILLVKDKDCLRTPAAKITPVLIMLVVFYAFLLFKPSEFLWENIPLLSEINYPWIILGMLGFLISLLAGFLAKQTLGKYIVVFFAIVAILIALPYAKPEKYINNQDGYYLTNEATTTSSNELMPLWVQEMPLQRFKTKVEIIKSEGKINNLSYNSKKISFSINSISKAQVKINTIYYPGWKISVDGLNTGISYNNKQGVMEISVSPGKHVVLAKFGETTLRLISDWISLFSFFVVLLLIVAGNKHSKITNYFK